MSRPETRGACPPVNSMGWRVCPWVGCRHHLYLDVNKRGKLQLRTDIDPIDLAERQPVCALDVADMGSHTLAEVGELLGVGRERVRQIEVEAIKKLKEHSFAAKWRELGEVHLREKIDRGPGGSRFRPISLEKLRREWPSSTRAQRLRLVRLYRRLPQDVLARRAGIERTTAAKYERGAVTMTHDTLAALCSVLDVEPADLDDDTPPPLGKTWAQMQVCERLAWVRKKKGLRQVDAAERIGIGHGHYSQIETGQHQHEPTVERAADALGVTLADLRADTPPTLKAAA